MVGDGLLHSGCHHSPPSGERCKMCVMELRSLVLGRGWTDYPDGDYDAVQAACRILNDAPWTSDEERTEHCLPLALLCEADAPEDWLHAYIVGTAREIVPFLLDKIGLSVHAKRLRELKDDASYDDVSVACITARDAACDCHTKATYQAAYAAATSANNVVSAAYSHAAATDAAAEASYAAWYSGSIILSTACALLVRCAGKKEANA